MKLLYTTFLTFIVTITMTINGQTYVPYPQTGLIQGEIYYGPWTNPGTFNATIKYISDTVISSFSYSLFSNQYFGYHYTRYDNGKIYYAHRNMDGSVVGEELKYDFTLGLNDTFQTFGLDGNLVVDSISTFTLLNGQVRKYIRLKNSFQENYQWVDGIGDIERGFLYARDFEGGYERLVCYRDSSGLLYANNLISLDCDSLTGFNSVGIETLPPKGGFDISPVPSSDVINLNFHGLDTSELFIQIINPIGQTVFSAKVCKGISLTDIDLTHLENGIYFLRVSNKSMDTVKKLIKT